MTLWRGRCSPYVVQNVTGPRTSPVNEGKHRGVSPGTFVSQVEKNRRLSLTVNR